MPQVVFDLEFRYKGKKQTKYIFSILLGPFMYYFLNSIFPSFSRFVSLLFFCLVWTLIYGLLAYFGYRSNREDSSTAIRLDDSGISTLYNKAVKTSIPWEKVSEVYVTWSSVYQYSNEPVRPYIIVIKSKTSKIEIKDEINGFPLLVRTLKERFGERFNTRDLPVELKNPN